MLNKKILLSLLAFSFMSPIASHAANIGPDQVLLIKTNPDIKSHCIVKNSNNSWAADNTPAHVSIMKSGSGLDVECYSNDNLWHGTTHVDSKFSQQSLAGAIYGGLSNGATIFNNGDSDGQGMQGYWTQTKATIVVPLIRSTPIIKEAKVISNDEAYDAIPQNRPVIRHYNKKTHKAECDGKKNLAEHTTCSFE